MATAKKIPDNNYQVQLTLSPKEARYLAVLTGRVSGRTTDVNVFPTIQEVTGDMPYNPLEYSFMYEKLSKKVRDWVENGE